MTFEQERQYFIDEILSHGRTMKMWGFNQAMESAHGIEKANTQTHAVAQSYLKDKEMFIEHERQRVEYAIDKLIELKEQSNDKDS